MPSRRTAWRGTLESMPLRFASVAPARALAIIGIGAAALLLGSCAAIGDAGTVRASAAACSAVTAGIDDAVAAFQEVDTTDPAAAAAAVEDVAARLADARAGLDDEALSAVVGDLEEDLTGLAESLTAIGEGDLARASGLATATDGIRRSVTEFTRLCGDG